jgi:hypothetical protein
MIYIMHLKSFGIFAYSLDYPEYMIHDLNVLI